MENATPVLLSNNCAHKPHICWSAIVSGALIGVGLGFLLHLFGVAIGLSAYSSSVNGAKVIAIGGIIGLLIGVIASMGVAGFVAGYLGRFHFCYCHGGVIYGFLTWSVALLLSAIFVLPLNHFTATYASNLGPTAAITSPVNQVLHNNTTSADNTVQSNDEMNMAQPSPTEKKAFAWSAWIVFALFFIGGICSCIGACIGMNCKRHSEAHPEVH